MLRIYKLIVGALGIAVMLWGCADTSEAPARTQTESTAVRTKAAARTEAAAPSEANSQWIYAQGPNWKYVTGGNDYFAVYDNEGKEIYYEETHRDPRFTALDNHLLRMDVAGGNLCLITRFFDVQQGICSPPYENVLGFGYGKVVYMTQRDPADISSSFLVVHDIFDPERNSSAVYRAFAYGTALPIETASGLYTWRPVLEAELIDEHTLFIAYYNNQKELAEETLRLS